MMVPNNIPNENYVCEYWLWCPDHGHRSAVWSINKSPDDSFSMSKEIRYSFKRQYESVTYLEHVDCGTVTFLEERYYPAQSSKS